MFKKEYLHPNEGFSQVVVIETETTKTFHISGQIGEGNDLESQTISTFTKLDVIKRKWS
jgi:enamine deaminase RidA (YjgF/YER057c/UK114 family)